MSPVKGSVVEKTNRVVNSVRNLAPVLAKLLVGDDLGAGGDLALQPLGERSLSSNLASNLETIDESLGVVVLGIGLRAKRGGSVEARSRGTRR